MNKDHIVQKLKESLVNAKKFNIGMISETIIEDTPEALHKAQLRHSAVYSFYAGWLAIAKNDTLQSESAMEDCFDANFVRLKELNIDKKVTDTFIKSQITAIPEYKKLREIYFKNKEGENLLSAIVKGLEQKEYMLFSTASTVRSEHKAGINLNNIEKLIQENLRNK